VDREEEGMISNLPELVTLWECLETHLILAKTADTDILRVIIVDVHSTKRQTSDPRWDGWKRSKKRLGSSQPTEPFISGQKPLRPRREHLPPDNPYGPKQSTTEYDRKQVKSKPTKYMRRGRKSDGRRTYHEKEKERSRDISEEGQELLEDKDIWGNKQTGFFGKEREESWWENGWKWPRLDHKTKEEYYRRTPTPSRRTRGFTK
jgi:hypothetical protein